MILHKLAPAIAATLWLALPPAAPVAVPFELVNRHIVIDATVNGSKPLSFVLDTGDRVAIVDLDRARELGLKLGDEIQVGGIGASRATGYLVEGANVAVTAAASKPQPVVAALPLTPLATRLGHAFDGILGGDFIRQFVVEIDYAGRILRLHDPATFAYQGNGDSLPIRFNASGHPMIEAAVTPLGGQPITGTFVIDIGSGGGLALTAPFNAAHHLPQPGETTVRAIGVSGTGGEGSGQFGRIAALQIGRRTLPRPLVLFSSDAAGSFGARAYDGNIGYEILRRFRLFLDYPHERIIFEALSGFDAPFNRPSTGLTFETAPRDVHAFTVTGALEQTPASEAGIRAGDVIAAIDGRPAAELTLSGIIDLFERPVRRTLSLRRGGETLTVAITPRVLVP